MDIIAIHTYQAFPTTGAFARLSFARGLMLSLAIPPFLTKPSLNDLIQPLFLLRLVNGSLTTQPIVPYGEPFVDFDAFVDRTSTDAT